MNQFSSFVGGAPAPCMSIPVIDEDRERLLAIPGTVPSAANFPGGCRFAARCTLAQPSCMEKMPELRELRPNQFVRCDLA